MGRPSPETLICEICGAEVHSMGISGPGKLFMIDRLVISKRIS